ncbi:MAG: hypothetical protein AAF489_08720 [Bacteroidota bacterium]
MPVSLSSSVKGFQDIFIFQPENYYYIELDNFVVAFDAPRHPAITRNIIRLIGKETNKPIQYVVVSHAHEAHIAGLRPFIEEGATIITTEKASSIIEEIASIPSSNFAGLVFGKPIEVFNMKFVDSEKSITTKDGKRRVEIFNIGDSLNAEGNLVAYLKEENVLIQGGLYSYEGEFNPTNMFFMDWLRKEKFEDAVVLGMGHLPIVAKKLEELKLDIPVTMELFEEKIAKIKATNFPSDEIFGSYSQPR